MKTLLIKKIFQFVLLFEILWGAHAWFTWSFDNSKLHKYIVFLFICFLTYLYQLTYKIKLSFSKKILISLFCFFLAYWHVSNYTIFSIVGCLFMLYPVWVLCSDKYNSKDHLDFVAKSLSILIVLGILQYFFLQYYSLPSVVIQYGHKESYSFFNYGFNIVNIRVLYESFSRFNSVFLEPGYMSALLCFMLYALNYDFHKRYIRILVYGLILSFSLAGYILFAVGFFFSQMQKKKAILFRILCVISFVCAFAFVGENYNQGKNLVNERILTRLKYDEEKGLSGNNRTSDMTREYLLQGFFNGDVLWGLGQERVQSINKSPDSNEIFSHDKINGTGFEYYIVVYGLIPVFFYFLFYVYLGRYLTNNKKYAKGFIVMILLCFMQSSYPSSASWIYPFILGLKNSKY